MEWVHSALILRCYVRADVKLSHSSNTALNCIERRARSCKQLFTEDLKYEYHRKETRWRIRDNINQWMSSIIPYALLVTVATSTLFSSHRRLTGRPLGTMETEYPSCVSIKIEVTPYFNSIYHHRNSGTNPSCHSQIGFVLDLFTVGRIVLAIRYVRK